MKNLSIIHKILVVLAVVSAVFFGWMTVNLLRVPVAEFELEAANALAQAETLRAQKADREAALAAELAADELTLAQEESKQQELTTRLAEVEKLNGEKKAAVDEMNTLLSSLDNMPEHIAKLRTEYGNTIRQLEEKIVAGESDVKICYLTLDDGPTNITDQFLKKLEELDVYATFFTIGANNAINERENLRAEAMGGHAIANHSFSHAFDTGLYSGLEEFSKQVQLQDDKVFEATGLHTDVFRFPCGSYYCYFRDDAIEWLESNGYQYIDWSANAYDSGANASDKGAAVVANAMITQCLTMDICVLLAHDWNYSTLGALDIAIPRLKSEGYVFLPLFSQSLTMGDATRSQFG